MKTERRSGKIVSDHRNEAEGTYFGPNPFEYVYVYEYDAVELEEEDVRAIQAQHALGRDWTCSLKSGAQLSISPDGILTESGTDTAVAFVPFENAPQITGIRLMEGIRLVPNGCFSALRKVEALSLPASLRDIDDNAFFTLSLQTCELPNDIRYIASGVFHCPVLFQGITQELYKLDRYAQEARERFSRAFTPTERSVSAFGQTFRVYDYTDGWPRPLTEEIRSVLRELPPEEQLKAYSVLTARSSWASSYGEDTDSETSHSRQAFFPDPDVSAICVKEGIVGGFLRKGEWIFPGKVLYSRCDMEDDGPGSSGWSVEKKLGVVPEKRA